MHFESMPIKPGSHITAVDTYLATALNERAAATSTLSAASAETREQYPDKTDYCNHTGYAQYQSSVAAHLSRFSSLIDVVKNIYWSEKWLDPVHPLTPVFRSDGRFQQYDFNSLRTNAAFSSLFMAFLADWYYDFDTFASSGNATRNHYSLITHTKVKRIFQLLEYCRVTRTGTAVSGQRLQYNYSIDENGAIVLPSSGMDWENASMTGGTFDWMTTSNYSGTTGSGQVRCPLKNTDNWGDAENLAGLEWSDTLNSERPTWKATVYCHTESDIGDDYSSSKRVVHADSAGVGMSPGDTKIFTNSGFYGWELLKNAAPDAPFVNSYPPMTTLKGERLTLSFYVDWGECFTPFEF